MSKFLDFLYDSDDESLGEVRRDLEAFGVDVPRFENRVAALINRVSAARAGPQHWLERARQRQAQFEKRLRERSAELRSRFRNAGDLATAMLAGELGLGAQTRAAVFFRNKRADELSDADLRSLAEDCVMLEELKRAEDGHEPRES